MIAAFSACHEGVPSPVSLAILCELDRMGTVWAPSRKTTDASRARSRTCPARVAGTSSAPAPAMPSDCALRYRASSASAPSHSPVANPFK